MAFLDDQLIFEGDTKTLGGVLQNFGNDLQDKLRENLKTKVRATTPKTLQQSIVFSVKMKELGVWSFKLFYEDYGDFLDQGVAGAGGTRKSTSAFGAGNKGRIFKQRAPQSPFRFRKLKPPLDERGAGWSLRDYARANGFSPYALQETIFRSGIKATRWYSDVVTQKLIDTLSISLARAGAKNIELEVTDILTGRTNAE